MNKNSIQPLKRVFPAAPFRETRSEGNIWSLKLLTFLLASPIIGSLFCRQFKLVCWYITLLEKTNKHQDIYDILVKILKGNIYTAPKKTHTWWFFLRLLVAFMQEQQIQQFLIFPDLEDDLINLALNGPGKKAGYNVAYIFVGFSLWMFERGEVKKALDMIKVASVADQSWGYPEYLYGWFGLFTPGVDSATHFGNAVHADWNFLTKIRKDKTCQRYPNIIRAVSQQVVVHNNGH